MARKLMFALLLLVVPSLALAVPLQIPYSGQLSEIGSPVNGVVELTIKLYPTPAGGSELYSESFPGTVVQNGVYHLMLNVPPNVWDGTDRWLAVSVNGGSPLEPRVQISSVPYAVRAGSAEALVNPLPQPGVNWQNRNQPNIEIWTPTTWVPIDSVSINAPASGFVTVHFCGSGRLRGSVGGTGEMYLQIKHPSEAFLPGGDVILQAAPSTIVFVPLGMTRTFAVNPGVNTFMLYVIVGPGSMFPAHMFPRTITAVWFPNRYQ